MGLYSSRDKRPFVGIRFLLKNELLSEYIKKNYLKCLKTRSSPYCLLLGPLCVECPCPRALPIIQPMVKATIRTLLDFYRVLQWQFTQCNCAYMNCRCFERHNAHSYGHFIFLKLGASISNTLFLLLIFYQKNKK